MEWSVCTAGLVAAAALLAERQRQLSCEEVEPSRRSKDRWIDHGQLDWDEKDVLRAEIVAAIRSEQRAEVLHKVVALPSIDAPITSSGSSTLGVACSMGDLKIVTALLVQKANPATLDGNGASCVARACADGHLKIVRRLYRDERVDLRLPDNWGYAPLHHAIAGGHLEVVEYLLDASVDPNSPTGGAEDSVPAPRQETPMQVAASRLSVPRTLLYKPQRYEAFSMLLGYNADPLRQDRFGDTVLHLLGRQGDMCGLWLILASIEDVSAALEVKNLDGVTVLDDIDCGTSLMSSVAARLATFLPQVSRGWLLSIMFNEQLNTLIA